MTTSSSIPLFSEGNELVSVLKSTIWRSPLVRCYDPAEEFNRNSFAKWTVGPGPLPVTTSSRALECPAAGLTTLDPPQHSPQPRDRSSLLWRSWSTSEVRLQVLTANTTVKMPAVSLQVLWWDPPNDKPYLQTQEPYFSAFKFTL